MMTLVPGREYPKCVYHATKPSIMVHSAQQRAALGSEWSDTYIYQPYPKAKYYWGGKIIKVANAEEDAALEKGWANTPAAFEPYQGPRPPKTENQDPARWVDAWAVVGLSAAHRNRIKAHLLRVDASFWRSPDAASADMDAMRQAFAGIAKVLAEAGILTEELLKNEIPTLVWDSGIAGGWYRFASEAPQDIFPEQLGHYWVWRNGERDWKDLFYSETREWFAWLLENPQKNTDDPNETPQHSAERAEPGIPPSVKRGPKPNYETALRVAETVKRVAGEDKWRSQLDEICLELDENVIPRPKTWKMRGYRHWFDALTERDIVEKAIAHHLKLASKHRKTFS